MPYWEEYLIKERCSLSFHGVTVYFLKTKHTHRCFQFELSSNHRMKQVLHEVTAVQTDVQSEGFSRVE